MKIVQRKMDPAKWVQHFKEQAMGVKHPARDGYIFVGNQVGKGSSSNISRSPVKIVSPVQQVVDQAEAEIKREGKGIKRKSSFPQPQLKKKARRGKRSTPRSKRVKTKKGRSKQKNKTVTKKKTKKDIFGK